MNQVKIETHLFDYSNEPRVDESNRVWPQGFGDGCVYSSNENGYADIKDLRQQLKRRYKGNSNALTVTSLFDGLMIIENAGKELHRISYVTLSEGVR